LKTGKVNSVGADQLRWLAAISLVVAGVGGNWYFQSESVLLRVAVLLAMIGLSVFIIWNSRKGQEIVALLRESRSEVRRVVWPTNQETNQTTLIVLVIVLIFSLILWGLDSLLGWIISSIIG
jgi:preprotein translocase subunit SecE